MTNLVFCCCNQEVVPPASVIVRVYSSRSTVLFSRQQERGIFLAASRLGIGPRCLLEFANGRVEEFLPGEPLTAAAMRQPEVARAVAASLAEFHVELLEALPMVRTATNVAPHPAVERLAEADGLEGGSPRVDEGGETVVLWQRLRGWLATAKDIAPAECTALGLDGLEAELDAIEATIDAIFGPPWLAFCHNDLQCGNILLQEVAKAEENTRLEACLIDYEYATVGDVGFDVANHFCEYAADYSGAGDILDWKRLPSETEKLRFCEAYVWSLFRLRSSSKLAATITTQVSRTLVMNGKIPDVGSDLAAAAAALCNRATAHMPLSDLKWGLWGIIQAKTSEVTFDYLGYAQCRLQRYHATKAALLKIGNN